MSAAPIIMTERLRLRPIRVEDAADVFDYARNPNVLRYTTGETPKQPAETEAFLKGQVDKPDGAFALAICLKDDTRVIGMLEFGCSDDGVGGVHYSLSEEHWSRGIATEAVQALLDWAFRNIPTMTAVTTNAMSANRGSTRVMEKCGMSFVETTSIYLAKFGQPVELAVYSIPRGKWESTHAQG